MRVDFRPIPTGACMLKCPLSLSAFGVCRVIVTGSIGISIGLCTVVSHQGGLCFMLFACLETTIRHISSRQQQQQRLA